MATARQRPAGEAAASDDGATRENRVLRHLVAVYHHLAGLALQSANLDSVVELLASRTGAAATVVSPTLDMLAASRGPGTGRFEARDALTGRGLGRVLGAVASTRRALRLPGSGSGAALIVAPILVGDEIVAYLVVEEAAAADAGEDLGLLVTEHAATICGVVMGRERIVAAAAGRARHDLVEGLLLGRAASPEETARWAQHLGYDPAHRHRVVCLVVDAAGGPPGDDPIEAAARRRRILSGFEHLVARQVADAVVAPRDDELVMIARETGGTDDVAGPRALAGACLQQASRAFPSAVVTGGVGGACQEPWEIARSYAQARRTIELSRRLGRTGQVVAFEELGIHRLLLQVPDLAELRAYVEEVLGPLVAHERRHHTGYLRTLAAYFRENGSLQRAARALHVHPNTVTYRLGRIQELAGLDLGSYQDRLMAQVALEILAALEDVR